MLGLVMRLCHIRRRDRETRKRRRAARRHNHQGERVGNFRIRNALTCVFVYPRGGAREPFVDMQFHGLKLGGLHEHASKLTALSRFEKRRGHRAA